MRDKKDFADMTPREFFVMRRPSRVGAYRQEQDGRPEWRKLGGGYIGVTDGSPRGYVAPGLIFAVEIRGGEPVICSYRRHGLAGLAASRPYTAGSLRHLLNFGETGTVWDAEPMTFDEMAAAVLSVYPDASIPTPADFLAEYGCGWNRSAKRPENVHGLREG